MLLRPAYLSQKLDRPLPTKDGGTLRTIGEACDYMTSMGKKRELQPRWQRVCKLILAKEDVLTVSRALQLALFMDARLEVSQPDMNPHPIQDINDGNPWSEMDLFDLRNSLAYGRSIEEVAGFLCRSGTVEEAKRKAEELGLLG